MAWENLHCKIRIIMNRLILIIGGIVILGILSDVLDTIISRISKERPPRLVRITEKIEMVFGVAVLISSIYFIYIEEATLVACVCIAIGLFWLLIALGLYLGNNWARTISLILSILRLPTIVGILFSLPSVYLLFFTKQSKAYFSRKSEQICKK